MALVGEGLVFFGEGRPGEGTRFARAVRRVLQGIPLEPQKYLTWFVRTLNTPRRNPPAENAPVQQ